MVLLKVIMAIPGLTSAVPELNEAHATFGESASDEELSTQRGVAVHLARFLGLAADIKSIRGLELHAVGHLERLGAGLEGGVLRAPGLMGSVELTEQVELLALGGAREAEVANVLDEFLDASLGGVDVVALVDARQEAALPVLGLLNGEAAGAKRHEAGKVLVLRAEAIGHP